MARNPFDTLRSEHRLLARVVDAFEVFLESDGDEDQRSADFATFARFFRDVAERGHHEKEERALDPFLVQCGFDWESGPLSRVRKYHDGERKLIRVLLQAANDGWPVCERPSRERVVRAARSLIASQRAHIRLEDTLVFPIADRKLDEHEHEALASGLAEYDRMQGNTEAFRDTLHGVELLCLRYAPRASAEPCVTSG
jgi:hemerythrin-like domain-containing protein